VPLAGIGPALFLHALVLQNLGGQAVLGGRSQVQAFLLVMAANLAGLAAGSAQPAHRLHLAVGDLAAAGFVAITSTASDHRGGAVTIRPA
jgi:hypothetical protein